MAAKFHAMTSEDYRKLGPIVKSGVGIDGYSVLDNTYMYSDYDMSDIEQSLAKLHTRSVISLTSPTFNFVLGRSNGTLLSKMLGVSSGLWQNIVSMETIYDVEAEDFIPVDSADVNGHYLYGAEIAEMLIKKLDIEKAKVDCLYSAIGGELKDSINPRSVCTVDKTPEGLHICADYYAHFDPEVMRKSMKRGRVYEDLSKSVKSNLFKNADTRFTYLMNMNPDKSGLYGMLNYYIAVIPEEMRPKIDRSEHKLTKRYTNVLKADYELRTIKGMYANPKDVKVKYAMLQQAVSRLQYKNVGLGDSVEKDDLALLERIKTKKGQIRMHNLGKRQDYSGRAVVCINPYLPLDTIRVPKSMLPKLLEFHVLPYLAANLRKNKDDVNSGEEHTRNLYDKLRLTNLSDPETQAEMLRIIREEKILDRVPMVLGRQPTLHKQSLQGFHVEISDLQAIEVNPLVCPAFNMDFDGDQGHIEVPLSDSAVKEVNDLVMTTQNLFLAKTGECTTEPRQDMLYGLYMCTRSSYVVGANVIKMPFENLEEVRQAVMQHKVKCSDTITVMKPSFTCLAGEAAVMACFREGDVLPRGSKPGGGQLVCCEISKKTITKFVEHLLRTDTSGNMIYPIGTGYAKPDTFVGAINHMVELGFRVAKIYSPSMSLITPRVSLPEYDNAISKFHKDMEEADFYYGLGLETSDNYKIEFDKALKGLKEACDDNIMNKLGENNGYRLLSVSGARGSKDNLIQAFAYKGRVKKNSNESFDALLENSYASQLTPLEHFVAAYGGRQGQIDKSLKTGDTGYAMRQMWHATQGMAITNDDCGTNQGIHISKSFLSTLVDTSDTNGDASEDIKKEVSEVFVHAIVGRYRVGSSKIITKAEAEKWAADDSINEVVIRSPLTCANPCCVKCYGIDWSTHKPAIVGLPAGIIAAQSIGEPGTQLTLKQFQKGGVAGKAEVTSAFDKVNNYIHVADLAEKSKKGNYPGYDPLAWADGKVIETPTSDINTKLVTIEGCKGKSIKVPKNVVLKEYAVKGQGLSYRHGDYNIKEILKYCGIEEAQRYLVFKLFYLYKSEVQIALVHFEILAACMTRYMIMSTDRKNLMIGQYCTSQELHAGNLNNTVYEARLLSVQELLQASNEAMDSIIMENQVQGLSRICLLELEDSLTKPINRMVLGQTIVNGSNTPGFVKARKEKIV